MWVVGVGVGGCGLWVWVCVCVHVSAQYNSYGNDWLAIYFLFRGKL